VLAKEEEMEEEIIEEVVSLPVPNKQTAVAPSVDLVIKAFPNPTAEKITVSFTGNNTPALLKIIGFQGKEVYREQIKPAQNYFQKILPIQKWVKGMATIQIEQKGETVQQKVIVLE